MIHVLLTKNILRLLLYLLGVATLAFGAVLAINSRLGVSPVNLIQISISHSTNLNLGVASFIFFIICICGQLFIYKKDFKLIQFLQILFAILFGNFLNFFNEAIRLEGLSITMRIILCIISILLIGIGIFLTVTPKLVPLAPDGMAQAIAFKMKADFGKGKIVFDIIIVSTSFIFLFLSSAGFHDIGIGTILSMLLVGKVVLEINRFFKEKLEKMLF